MDIGEALRRTVQELNNNNANFALCGGLAANVYRKEIRGTQDVDIALLSVDGEKIANKIIGSLGLKAVSISQADLDGGPLFKRKRANEVAVVVIGRDKNNSDSAGVDFLLSEIAWIEKAVYRAQYNQIDFGFGKIPTLTIEDIIITKLFAFSHNKTRYKDLDDVRSICEAGHSLDIPYLAGLLNEYELYFPKEMHDLLEPSLGRLSRKIERRGRKRN